MIDGDLPGPPPDSEAELERAIADTLAEMRDASGPRLVDLGARMVELVELRDQYRDSTKDDLRHTMSQIEQTVRALGDAASSEELMRRACRGFADLCRSERVVLCKLEDAQAIPVMAFDSGDVGSPELPPALDITPGSAEAAALAGQPQFDAAPLAALRPVFGDGCVIVVVPIEAKPAGIVYLAGTIDAALHDSVTMLAEVLGACFARLGLAARRTRQLNLLRASTRSWVRDIETPSHTDLSAASVDAGPLVEPLTGREIEVLRLILTGASNSAIADELVITVDTVKSHVKRVLRKLGATNRGELIAKYDGADLANLRTARP
ncbi:LuxR C-terminal-related transcriptional regulator [Nocardia sp. NPDC004860]|uniref:helix-turn-helix transcriptional regulator n=1 Tax=Nocardia sp. NPDC004860 TaxID=3154557 RepID=UPI0033B4B6AC